MPTSGFATTGRGARTEIRPNCASAEGPDDVSVIEASEAKLGTRYLYCDGHPGLLFTENETNTAAIFGVPNRTPYVKDGINNAIVQGEHEAVNPARIGHQGGAALCDRRRPGESRTLRLRLTDHRCGGESPFGAAFR